MMKIPVSKAKGFTTNFHVLCPRYCWRNTNILKKRKDTSVNGRTRNIDNDDKKGRNSNANKVKTCVVANMKKKTMKEIKFKLIGITCFWIIIWMNVWSYQQKNNCTECIQSTQNTWGPKMMIIIKTDKMFMIDLVEE